MLYEVITRPLPLAGGRFFGEMTFLPPDLDNHRKLQESCGLTKEWAEEAVEKS